MNNCWSCKSIKPPIVSERTGMEYCPDCFRARNGKAYLTGMNEVMEDVEEEPEKVK